MTGGSRAGGPDGPWRPWQEAWQDALYGPGGFYRRPEGPAGHFRTSAHSPWLAVALARLARAHDCTAVVDVGAGRGELLSALAQVDPDLGLLGVDVVDRPAALDGYDVEWLGSPGGAALPALGPWDDVLVVAHEWLDVVPQPVLATGPDGVPRLVEVAPDGTQRPGPLDWPGRDADLDWCERWWPLTPDGVVEVGRVRDEAWESLCRSVSSGVLLAVDYDHTRAARPPAGSLTGYAAGRQVPPVPDGSCDLTTHVALDSCAAAGAAATAREGVAVSTSLRRQHEWLRELGVDRAALELLDPAGLGGFGWLVHVVA